MEVCQCKYAKQRHKEEHDETKHEQLEQETVVLRLEDESLLSGHTVDNDANGDKGGGHEEGQQVDLVLEFKVLVTLNLFLPLQESNQGVDPCHQVHQRARQKNDCQVLEPSLLRLYFVTNLLQLLCLLLMVAGHFKDLVASKHVYILLCVESAQFLQSCHESAAARATRLLALHYFDFRLVEKTRMFVNHA